MIILDTDIISAFAKADSLDLVLKLFRNEIYITPKICEELQMPLYYGYSYPKEIFKKVKILTPNPEEQEIYLETLSKNTILGKGELEGICIAKERNYRFSSLDKKAVEFAKSKGIKVVVLKAILRTLLEKRICSKEEVRSIIKNIEERDNRTIDVEEIFETEL